MHIPFLNYILIAMKRVIVVFVIAAFAVQCWAQKAPGADRAWWNSLPKEWKDAFVKELGIRKQMAELPDVYLEELMKIRRLNVSNNQQIQGLEPLKALQHLEMLNVSKTQIRSLKGIENLAILKELNCSYNDNIMAIDEVAQLVNLKVLNIMETMVISLGPLRDLNQLEDLNCEFTTIRSLAPLGNLPNLLKLNVAHNPGIYELSFLSTHKKLLELNCSYTNVESLGELENHESLQVLDVSYTPLTSVRQLIKVRTLTELNISGTQCITIKYLMAHPFLKVLSVTGAQVPKHEILQFRKQSKDLIVVE
ncbi:MAG: hypothetical protein RIS47_1396 [Bacteroidota bacterium]|jgi:Leucine-rich repeat (LRR) protein